MTIQIFLALQTYADGRVAYRRCTTADISPRFIPGGVFSKKTPEAKAWLERAGNPRWEAMPDLTKLQPFEEVMI